MKKIKYTFVIFLLIFTLLNISIIYGITKSKENLSSYFRIHVVANSDSISDQMLKLNIAQNVDEYINELTKNVNSKEEYIKRVEENITEILSLANSEIAKNNFNYKVEAYIGNMKYDEKSFDEYIMPKGTYTSLKIIIGDGLGENWWSLLYPNSIEGMNINDTLTDEDISFDFKILNIFRDIKDFIYNEKELKDILL